MWPLTDGNHCLRGAEADLFRGAVGMMVDQLVIEINGEADDFDAIREYDELMQTGSAEDALGQLPADDYETSVPHLFAMWEPCQRIWLLERVTTSVLSTRSAPPSSAIFEATIEAVYVEVGDLIALEICEGQSIEPASWRQTLLDAFVQRCPKDSLLEAMQFEVTAIDPCLPPSIAEKLRVLDTTRSDGETEADAAQRSGDAGTSRSRDWFAWWAMILDRLVDATYGPRLHGQLEPLLDGDPRQVARWLQNKGVNSKFHSRIPPLRTLAQTQTSIQRLQSLIFCDDESDD